MRREHWNGHDIELCVPTVDFGGQADEDRPRCEACGRTVAYMEPCWRGEDRSDPYNPTRYFLLHLECTDHIVHRYETYHTDKDYMAIAEYAEAVGLDAATLQRIADEDPGPKGGVRKVTDDGAVYHPWYLYICAQVFFDRSRQ